MKKVIILLLIILSLFNGYAIDLDTLSDIEFIDNENEFDPHFFKDGTTREFSRSVMQYYDVERTLIKNMSQDDYKYKMEYYTHYRMLENMSDYIHSTYNDIMENRTNELDETNLKIISILEVKRATTEYKIHHIELNSLLEYGISNEMIDTLYQDILNNWFFLINPSEDKDWPFN